MKNVGKSANIPVRFVKSAKQPTYSIHTAELQLYLTKLFPDYSLDAGIKNTIPVRILSNSGPEKAESFRLTKKTSVQYGEVSGVYPKMNVFLFKYKSISKTDKAFSNWIKSIGDSDDINIMENKKYVKTAPIHAIKSDKAILVLYYLCEHAENNWDSVKEILDSFFYEDTCLIMDIKCGGPLSWEKKQF